MFSADSLSSSSREEHGIKALAEPRGPHARRTAGFSPKAVWFSRDSHLLFVENLGGFTHTPSIQAWDIAGPTPVSIITCPAKGVAPDARRVATADFDHISRWNPEAHDNSVVKVFDLPSPLPRLQFKETGVHKATISPDGKMLALPSARREFTRSAGIAAILNSACRFVGIRPIWLAGSRSSVAVRDIRLHDASTGRFVAAINCSKGGHSLPDVEFSPDSKTLIVKYSPANFALSSGNPMTDWSVELWDVPAGPARGWVFSPWGALTAVALMLAGVVFDWRAAHKANHSSG